MKVSIQQLLLLATATCPLLAIEPPVESQPIAPQKPAGEAPAPPVAKVVPIPADQAERPYIGVILEPVPEILSRHLKLADGVGVVVGETVAGGPAEGVGLEAEDLITGINGKAVGSPEQVRAEVELHGVGDEVELDVIHGGEKKKVKVKLGAAPEMVPGFAGFGGGPVDIDQLLENLPEEQANMMRQAMKHNLRAFEEDMGGAEAAVPQKMRRELLQRLERGLNGQKAGGAKMQMQFGAESTMRLLDDQGSIEMKTQDGNKEAKAFDKSGKLLWEGPYDTEQDKAAVPDDIRERIDRLDFDVDFNDGNLRLKMLPERFRKLDDLEPEKRAPEGDE